MTQRFQNMLWICTIALLIIATVSGFIQVLARFVLHAPMDWTEFTTRFALIWMVYLGSAIACLQGSMLSVDLLQRKLSGRPAILLNRVVLIATAAFFFLLVYYGIEITWRVRFQVIAGTSISISWAYAAIPVGGMMSVIGLLIRLINTHTGKAS